MKIRCASLMLFFSLESAKGGVPAHDEFSSGKLRGGHFEERGPRSPLVENVASTADQSKFDCVAADDSADEPRSG